MVELGGYSCSKLYDFQNIYRFDYILTEKLSNKISFDQMDQFSERAVTRLKSGSK
jgi:hypothetical protein